MIENEKNNKVAYIHIPFCKSICTYCDFCKLYYNKEWVIQYLKSLENEIFKNYKGEKLDAIYIGGGTPNILDNENLEELLNILKNLNINDNIEYTIECNPELITEEQIEIFKKYGINRVSLGVQTFNKKLLKYLGRQHTKKDVLEKIKLLRKNYIENINIDLIYAIPTQTMKDLKGDIEYIKQLDIPHVSAYSLIIEPHTILYNNKTEDIDQDLDAKMYEYIKKELYNYNNYEISNYAKNNYESKHNLTYWNNEEYYGFGLGASGYINGIRYDNTKKLNDYLKGKYLLQKYELTKNEKCEYEFLLGFRKTKGIDIKKFENKYKYNPTTLKIVKNLLEEGKLIEEDNFIKIDSKYMYVSNEILINFIDFKIE